MERSKMKGETVLIWAVVAGVVTLALLAMLTDFGLIMMLVLAIVVAVLVALYLTMIREKSTPDSAATRTMSPTQALATSQAATATPQPTTPKPTAPKPELIADAPVAPVADSAAAPVVATQPAAVAPADAAEMTVKASVPLAGQADLATRKGTWRYEAPVADVPAVAQTTNAEPVAVAPDPAPTKPVDAAETTIRASAPLAGQAELSDRKGDWRYEAPDRAGAAKSSATSARVNAVAAAGSTTFDDDADMSGSMGVTAGTRPAALNAPRGGKADDLKQIKGVGPKMEKMCNALGFFHFEQIAAWTPDEVAWVDQNLEGFKGRVTRDTWVEQARLLAAGEATEFSKKVVEGGVY